MATVNVGSGGQFTFLQNVPLEVPEISIPQGVTEQQKSAYIQAQQYIQNRVSKLKDSIARAQSLSRSHAQNVLRIDVSNMAQELQNVPTNLQTVLSNLGTGVLQPGQESLQEAILGGAGTEELSTLQQVKAQREVQAGQLEQFRTGLRTQLFGSPTATLEEALGEAGTGQLASLAKGLRTQAGTAFREELFPLIQQRLARQGILDSGALEAVSGKEFGRLESQRQGALLQAGLGAQSQLSGLERADIMGDIGLQQAGLQRIFNLADVQTSMSFQRELSNQRNSLMRELQELSGPSSLDRVLQGLQIAAPLAAGLLTGGLGFGYAAGLGVGAGAGAAEAFGLGSNS